MKNFVLIGVGGFVAQRHLKAIKETGNNLIAALDKHDSVGILDSYFPEAHFFTEFERFDRHCEKLKIQGTIIHYVVVCSPNYLHDAHIRFGLRIGANVICEKPVVLNPWNIDALQHLEQEQQKKVFPILQLRLHPQIIALRDLVQKNQNEIFNINLIYITPRGNWYLHSWKGDREKSGGIASNIGIHFFDILIWIFGEVQEYSIDKNESDTQSGILKFKKAHCNWLLSINKNLLAQYTPKQNLRMLKVNDQDIDLSNNFLDLHTTMYQQILLHKGFTLQDAKPSIEIISKLRMLDEKNKH